MNTNQLTISQLKTKWNKEKESYKFQELGTGVQSFVKNVLESSQIFNLKEGKLSTRNEDRKEEFIHEKKTKNHRRGDFVVFINSEIIIPIEVECYGSIEGGKKQLYNYQRDLRKKYGILTDGFTWRFYNNHILIKEFYLNEIFSDPVLFVDFWKEYIKPKYYYLSFLEKRGQLFLFENKLFVEKNREAFFEDITTLIKSFKNKLKIEDYFKELPEKEREKRAIEITYAYIIQFILYKTLVDNDFSDFVKKHEQNVEKIYQYITNSRYKDILGTIDRLSTEISKNIYRPFSQEQKAISKRILQLYQNENKLSDVSPWLDIFVFVNKYNFQNVRNEIFGYIYENYLKELFEEEKLGQYFTDSEVVNFMLQQIGYTVEQIKRKIKAGKLDKLSIIDPACGSGTFLYKAVNEMVRSFSQQTNKTSRQIREVISNNVFGLDIAEFPLYLAEMNIIMRLLPFIIGEKYNNPIEKKIKVFKTKDSITEFIDVEFEDTVVDQNIRHKQFLIPFPEKELDYDSFMRDKNNLEEAKRSLKRQGEIPRRRFDYVIANPPYIGYNQCCRQKVLIFDSMKRGKVKLNNIYGVNLHSTPKNQKKYAPKPNLYAFFIALGLALLKDNAKLCYITPQTILTAGDLDVLRYHLAKYVTIEKIITFSGNLFIGRGIKQQKVVPTSSLIFIIRKTPPIERHEVEIINYKDNKDTIEDTFNNILAGRKIDRKKIPQVDLLRNLVNWNFIKQGKKFLDFYEEYQRNTDDISIYYEHILAEQKFGNRFYFDGGGNILENKIINEKIDAYEIFDYKNNNYIKLTLTTGSGKYYPKNEKITFPQGSQGIKVFQQQYKIIWRTKDAPKFQFCDKEILLISNQSLTISSNNKQEILFLLFLLNSPINRLILEKNLLQEQEQAFFIPIKAIKEYVHVPKITKGNQHIKDEIIERTEETLVLEEKTLSDFIDFSDILAQRFKEARVKKGYLLLIDGDKTMKLKIKDNPEVVANVLSRELENHELKLKNKKISLSYLRNLPVADFKKQKKLKDYIDHLVFALYFKVPLSKGLLKKEDHTRIKNYCSKSKYYSVVFNPKLSK